jgi:hypothetical protein
MDYSQPVKTLDVVVRVAQIIGALTGFAALLVSCQALRTSRMASGLKDRPVIYLRSGERKYLCAGPLTHLSDEQMQTQGLPVNRISLFQQQFILRSTSPVFAENVCVVQKLRIGSIEREHSFGEIGFVPPDEQNIVFTQDIAQDEFQLMCQGVPLVLFFRITYQDAHGRKFSQDEFFRIDFGVLDNTLRSAPVSSVSQRVWEQAAGDSSKVGRLGSLLTAPGANAK